MGKLVFGSVPILFPGQYDLRFTTRRHIRRPLMEPETPCVLVDVEPSDTSTKAVKSDPYWTFEGYFSKVVSDNGYETQVWSCLPRSVVHVWFATWKMSSTAKTATTPGSHVSQIRSGVVHYNQSNSPINKEHDKSSTIVRQGDIRQTLMYGLLR